MIKVQFTGSQPNMYQVDRNYNLPSITGAVQWNGATRSFEVSTGASGGWQRIDNTVEFQVNQSGPDVWSMWNWIEEQKREQAKEKELRSKYPALEEAHKHYEFIKELVKAGPVNDSSDDAGMMVQSGP
jgi:hypothetical protein